MSKEPCAQPTTFVWVHALAGQTDVDEEGGLDMWFGEEMGSKVRLGTSERWHKLWAIYKEREKGETRNEENKISTSVSLGSHVCKLSQWEKVDAYVTIWILVFKILSATVGYSLLIISLTPCTVTSIPDVKNSMSFCSLDTF